MSHASPAPRARRPLGWLILLAAGQGASLALSVSGRKVGYQHYRLDQLATPGWRLVAVAVLALQLWLVMRAMRGEWEKVRRWLRDAFPPVARFAAGAVLLAVAAAPSRDVPAYGAELVFAFAVQLVAAANAYLLASALAGADAARLPIVREPGGESQGGTDRLLDPFALAAALAVTVACALLAVFVYERVPHLPDEIVYLLNARYFAEGWLVLPAPPVAAGFDVDLVHYDATRSFVPVPPGWPAILALGVRLGIPWFVNPVLSGVAVLLFHTLLRRLYDVRTARLATLLLASSPWFLFLGMSLMTHQASLVFTLAAALGVAVARSRQAAWPAALAGVATGMVGLIRPLEGVVVALILGLWSLGARHPLFRLLPSIALTIVTTAAAALTLVYNQYITGSATRFPLVMYSDKYYGPGANDLGFGARRGMGWGGLDPFPGHGVRDVIVNSLLNGSALNTELFAWATGSLILIVAAIAARRLQRTDWVMVGAAALVAGIHALYWFSGGPDFGARYWYLAIIPLVVLAARAPAALFGAGSPGASRATVAMLALTAAALLTFVPWRAAEKYHDYRGMTPAAREFARSHDFGRAIVLVRGRRQPDYHLASLENPLDLRSDATIWAWDRTAQVRSAVVAQYPDRPVYVVDGPTITGGGFRMVAGPLPPGSLAPDLPSSEDFPGVMGTSGYDGIQRRAP